MKAKNQFQEYQIGLAHFNAAIDLVNGGLSPREAVETIHKVEHCLNSPPEMMHPGREIAERLCMDWIVLEHQYRESAKQLREAIGSQSVGDSPYTQHVGRRLSIFNSMIDMLSRMRRETQEAFGLVAKQ